MRVFARVSFSLFVGVSGLVGGLASRLALSVFLDENRLKILGTGMSGCWRGGMKGLWRRSGGTLTFNFDD